MHAHNCMQHGLAEAQVVRWRGGAGVMHVVWCDRMVDGVAHACNVHIPEHGACMHPRAGTRTFTPPHAQQQRRADARVACKVSTSSRQAGRHTCRRRAHSGHRRMTDTVACMTDTVA